MSSAETSSINLSDSRGNSIHLPKELLGKNDFSVLAAIMVAPVILTYSDGVTITISHTDEFFRTLSGHSNEVIPEHDHQPNDRTLRRSGKRASRVRIKSNVGIASPGIVPTSSLNPDGQKKKAVKLDVVRFIEAAHAIASARDSVFVSETRFDRRERRDPTDSHHTLRSKTRSRLFAQQRGMSEAATQVIKPQSTKQAPTGDQVINTAAVWAAAERDQNMSKKQVDQWLAGFTMPKTPDAAATALPAGQLNA